MEFTVKEEYERLKKYHDKKPMIYEHECTNLLVTKIECVKDFWDGDKINVYVHDIWDDKEILAMTIDEDEVRKAYNRRCYKYWRQYNIIEDFTR